MYAFNSLGLFVLGTKIVENWVKVVKLKSRTIATPTFLQPAKGGFTACLMISSFTFSKCYYMRLQARKEAAIIIRCRYGLGESRQLYYRSSISIPKQVVTRIEFWVFHVGIVSQP